LGHISYAAQIAALVAAGDVATLEAIGASAQAIANATRVAARIAAAAAQAAVVAKVASCRQKYKAYKDAQNAYRNGTPYGKAKCCADATSARDLLQKEVDGREDYINSGCDKAIPTNADHPGELAAKKQALEKANDKVKELCK